MHITARITFIHIHLKILFDNSLRAVFLYNTRVHSEVVEWNKILYCCGYLMSNGFMLKRVLNAPFCQYEITHGLNEKFGSTIEFYSTKLLRPTVPRVIVENISVSDVQRSCLLIGSFSVQPANLHHFFFQRKDSDTNSRTPFSNLHSVSLSVR